MTPPIPHRFTEFYDPPPDDEREQARRDARQEEAELRAGRWRRREELPEQLPEPEDSPF